LGAIAEALNRGDFGFAAIAAVQTRTPELSREAAARLVNAEREMIKYDPNEPRDWHGRWTTGEAAPGPMASPASGDANSRGNESTDARASNPEEAAGGPNSSLIPAAFTVPDQEQNGADGPNPDSLEQEFEKKYDDLGPVDFAKRVIEFGDWLAQKVSRIRATISKPITVKRILKLGDCCQELQLSIILTRQPAKP
jgi:hypothetical protein